MDAGPLTWAVDLHEGTPPMLFALSTLGCPELRLSEAAALAAEQGYAGLELRSGPSATVQVDSPRADRRRWRSELDRLGVQALSVASYVKVCAAEVDDAAVVDAAVAQMRLAHDLGAAWVRVFPGGVRGGTPDPDLEQRAGRRLAATVAATHGLGVGLAVETHDSHPTARDVVRLLDAADGAPISVIWDALHTWLGGERPEDTAGLLAQRLAYLQVKDVASREDLSPLALGTGVLPLQQCLDAVGGQDLTQWVSWEYERVWHPEAPGLDALGEPGRRWLEEAMRAAPSFGGRATGPGTSR